MSLRLAQLHGDILCGGHREGVDAARVPEQGSLYHRWLLTGKKGMEMPVAAY